MMHRRRVILVLSVALVVELFVGQWALRWMHYQNWVECRSLVGGETYPAFDRQCAPTDECWVYKVGPFSEDRVRCPGGLR
jgi:hypothetical protein